MKRRLRKVKKSIMILCAIVIISFLSISTTPVFAWSIWDWDPWYSPSQGESRSGISWGYDDYGPWCP